MIVCLACGNCTDTGTCEVCGMILSTNDSHDHESDIPDLHNDNSKGLEAEGGTKDNYS